MTLFALADCNNFYASCERVFNPRLHNRPIVVLSNNDGCVVARSNEAKTLGIPMGIPLFKIRDLVKKHRVEVYSSNYALYGDMSRRVMNILQQHCADVEIYSIDEAFLKLDFYSFDEVKCFDFSRDLRAKILQWTGLPVSIGIAPTKTLAKLANHIAKKQTDEGVFVLQPEHPCLEKIGIEEVWGVGGAYKNRLNAVGVETVAQFAKVNEYWMKKEFGIVGLRMLKELKGFPCLDLESPVESRKNTMVSRSFKSDIYELEELCEAVAIYATRLGEKLRRFDQQASVLTVFLWANRFKNKRPDGRTCFSRTIELPLSTANTHELIAYSLDVARAIHQKGTNYKKAGILASGLSPQSVLQTNLFVPQAPALKSAKLMKAMDEINRQMGRNTVYFAACGKAPNFKRRADRRSKRFTTRWEEMLVI